MTRWIFLLVLVASCTDFDPVQRGTCGNGLIEPGEDCDSSDATCQRCAITCTTRDDCPGAFACGVDHTCHAPSGTLADPVEGDPFPVSSLAVSDIDHDGFGDLVGVSSASITVRHGAPTGSLTRIDSIVTPQQLAEPAFGDLDGDGYTDVALTTADGILAYTSPFQTLSPASASHSFGDGNEPLDLVQLFTISTNAFGLLAADSNGNLVYAVIDATNPSRNRIGQPCNQAIPIAEALATGYDFFRASDDPFKAFVDKGEVVISMSAGPALCVISFHQNGTDAPIVTNITPPNAPVLHERAFFARLDADSDRCPDLINADGGAVAGRVWHGVRTVPGNESTPCRFKSTDGAAGDPMIRLGEPGSRLVGRVAIVPPLLFTASDAIVTTEAIQLYPTIPEVIQPTLFYSSQLPIVRVESGDFNGDGLGDAVVQRADSDDVDVVLRYGNPYGALAYRIDSIGVVKQLGVGDFDGNTITDIVYTEQTTSGERLMVSYGTPDLPLAATQVGVFGSIRQVLPFDLQDKVDTFNLATDLIVVENPRPPLTTEPRYLQFHGGPQRTFVAYIDPRDDGLRTEVSRYTASAIGHFTTRGPSAVFGALATDLDGKLVVGFTVPVNGVLIDDANIGAATAPALARCDNPRGYATGNLCANTALLQPWPTAAGIDAIIGIDRSVPPRTAVLAMSPTTVDATPIPALADFVTAGRTPSSMHVLAAGGTRPAQLLVTLRPVTPDGGTAIVVCDVDPSGTPTTCLDLVDTVRTALPAAECLDAAPIKFGSHADTPAPDDIVASCVGGPDAAAAALVELHVDDGVWSARVLASLPAPLRIVRGGDVTGDGVDDVVGVTTNDTLLVARQCTSRDLGCGTTGGKQ